MDPISWRFRRRVVRFPRPRGDGPPQAENREYLSGVSPPTRGWTPTKLRHHPLNDGFPAHAGMDPRRRRTSRIVPGFPRPRGDGPCPRRRRSPTATVSPPTRGWTRSSASCWRGIGGFPAHAGMDLNREMLATLRERFPRPRGDGPVEQLADPARQKVSPPTRGWTSITTVSADPPAGFPAHAGMDLDIRCHDGDDRRFPRPRGDGPLGVNRADGSPSVSPPTRGWTLDSRLESSNLIGFPAHAGMDLSGGSRPGACWRFPRPRGDGPHSSCTACRYCAVSPPTRGWTAEVPEDLRHVNGFPAHAGMDRAPGAGAVALLWFPRPRGDGPAIASPDALPSRVSPPTRGWTVVDRRRSAQTLGFPAHAGMDRWSWARSTGSARFPRPRGDGPCEVDVVHRPRPVSPPTRGWTACTRATGTAPAGFPAHAGMDLAPAAVGVGGDRFPRPRGDGPCRTRWANWTAWVSPPTRGWTRTADAGRGAVGGFPAHAGMDLPGNMRARPN